MDYKRIADSIGSAIERRPTDIAAYTDLFSLLRSWEEVDFKEAHGRNKLLLNACAEKLREVSGKELEQFYGQWRKCLLFEAPHDFDCYLRYIELDRKPEKRFYAPRSHYLRKYVAAYQKILDGELDFLSISMPKRAGKSQLGINFTNMAIGRTNAGGGGASLNFKVAGGTTKPTSPKENTIWVNTSVAIPSWAFSATEPESPAAGMVWTSLGGANSFGFNALRKNAITLYPLTVRQYSGGTWVSRAAEIYQDGSWRKMWDGYLYKPGDECKDAGGSWISQAVPRTSSGTGSVRPITKGDQSMSVDGKSNEGTIIRKEEKINLSGQTKLMFDGVLYNPSSAGTAFWASLCVWSAIGNTCQDNVAAVYHQGSGSSGSRITVDVSQLSGEFYIGFALFGNATVTVKNLLLE